MLCYVMLCYVMLCYVMLCYVWLCYVIKGKTPCGIGYYIIESYGVVPFCLTLHIIECYCGQFTFFNSKLQPNLTFEIIIRSYR